MRLPKLHLNTASEEASYRLSKWLAEWQLDQEISAECRSSSWQLTLRLLNEDRIFDPTEQLTRGQVRLFHPDMFPPDSRPVYFVVLDTRDSICLAVPFGRFSEPALPGEYLTNRDVPCLRVLCIWNIMLISLQTAERSWLTDIMTIDELQDARLAFFRRHDGLPNELLRRSGPPCWHPSDPRQQYKTEELALMQPLQESFRRSALLYPEIESRLDIAAEDRENWHPEDN